MNRDGVTFSGRELYNTIYRGSRFSRLLDPEMINKVLLSVTQVNQHLEAYLGFVDPLTEINNQ